MKLKLAYFIIFILVFAYIVVRAAMIGITYDEAWTIQSFVPLSLFNIFGFNPADANNQILNTVLIKAFFVFGNHSLFIARLPNIIAFVVYAYFAYRFADHILYFFSGMALFILLLFNPFVLDFFSLARGYGLALAFELGSLFYLMMFGNALEWKKYALSLLFAMLAALSNFTYLYFFLAIFLIGVIMVLLKFGKGSDYRKVLLSAFVALVLMAALIAIPIKKLIINGGLYYGGSTGFYHDTLASLFAWSMYNPYHLNAGSRVVNIFFILIGLICVFFFYKKFDETDTAIQGKTVLIFLVTISVILINLLNHYIFGTLFLTDRTALLYFPLIIMILVFLVEEIVKSKVKFSAFIILFLVCTFYFINFGINANLSKTISWPFDTHSQKILSKINSLGKKENKIKTIDFSWPFEKSIGYYVSNNNFSNIRIIKDAGDREKLNLKADYYIYYSKSIEKVGYLSDKQLIRNIKKDTAWSYKDEDIYVFSNLDTIDGGRN